MVGTLNVSCSCFDMGEPKGYLIVKGQPASKSAMVLEPHLKDRSQGEIGSVSANLWYILKLWSQSCL